MFIPVAGTTVYIATATDALVTEAPVTPDGTFDGDGDLTMSTTVATATAPEPADGNIRKNRFQRQGASLFPIR